MLLYLADLIIEYGLEHLDRMSIEEEFIPTKAMADIEDWFQKLKEMIISVSKKPYEEVKELLHEMAAFIGERHCELLGAKWFFEEYMHTPFTQEENCGGRVLVELEDVVRCYGLCKKKEEVPNWFMNELLEYEESYQKKKWGQ